jgi:hypothetical protein
VAGKKLRKQTALKFNGRKMAQNKQVNHLKRINEKYKRMVRNHKYG